MANMASKKKHFQWKIITMMPKNWKQSLYWCGKIMLICQDTILRAYITLYQSSLPSFCIFSQLLGNFWHYFLAKKPWLTDLLYGSAKWDHFRLANRLMVSHCNLYTWLNLWWQTWQPRNYLSTVTYGHISIRDVNNIFSFLICRNLLNF